MARKSTPTTEIDPLVAFYARRHPQYEGKLPHWVFCEQTYSGGREWFSSNIFKYLKEGEKEYADRVSRAYRPNHTSEAVNLIQKYLFKGGVARDTEGAPDAIQKFWKSASRNGQSISEVASRASIKSSLTGRCAIVVDCTRVETEDGVLAADAPMSVKQAEEAGIHAYTYVVPTVDILDYAWSPTDGKLLWIKLREYCRNDADPLADDGLTQERVRLWTRTDWSLYEQRIEEGVARQKPRVIVELVDYGRHDLGYVPVYLLDHSASSEDYQAASLIDDIAYLDRAIANYLSNLDAIIQDQTFSQLVIPSQSLPNSGNRDANREHLIEMGTRRVVAYDASAGSSAAPEFISPDPKQASVILSVINKIIAEIYQTIGMSGERTKQDNAVGIDNSSGVAKAYDFERINSLLLAKAQRLETMENWMVNTVLDWMGEPHPKEELVSYPTTFDVATLADELVTAEALQKVEAPIELRREQMRVILDKLLPQVKQEVWDAINKAITKWEPMPKVPAGFGNGADGKPVAAPKRQGTVTPDTKTKSAAK